MSTSIFLLVQLHQQLLAAMTPLHVALADQSPPLGHTFNDAGDWGAWLCSTLHADVVGLPVHAGQCRSEGTGDIQ